MRPWGHSSSKLVVESAERKNVEIVSIKKVNRDGIVGKHGDCLSLDGLGKTL